MRLASIDAGTNTLRLLIVTANAKGRYRAIERQRFITGLGTEFVRTGSFGSTEMHASIGALRKFGEKMRKMKVERYFAAGTQAFREALNARGFVEQVELETGIRLTVIDPEMEASLSFAGIVEAVGVETAKNSVIIDIGGGSTEIMRGGARRGKWASTNLGVVHLISLFSPGDPPKKWEITNMRYFIRDRLLSVRAEIGMKKAAKVIGTAGTYTTIAAIHKRMRLYNPEIINGTRLTRKRVANLAKKLYRLRAKEREEIPGMERGREYLIVPGLIIAEEAMDVFSANETVVSDGSLLEGIINAMQTRKIKGDVYEDPKL